MDRTVYVIGLDGVPPALVDRGVDTGRLPTFERLRDAGIEGTTRSTVPPISMMAWSTFATGRDPGNHGIYNFMLTEAEGYNTTFASATALRERSVPSWEYLDAHGLRTGVMNVMPGFPPSRTSGFHVSDHITTPPDEQYAYPDAVQCGIESVADEFVLGPPTADSGGAVPAELRAYVNEFFKIETDRVEVTKHLITEHPCHAMFLVFSAPDVFLHEVGHLLDEDNPQYDEAMADELGDAPLKLLVMYDEFLDWLMESMNPEDVLLVLSDHGHGSIYTAVNLNSWLYQNGYLALHSRPLTYCKQFLYNYLYDGAQQSLKRLGLYHAVKRRIARSSRGDGPDLASLLTLSQDDVDWANTTAFTTAGDGQIYINTTDYEHGIVEPSEYESVRMQLRADLLAIRHPERDEPIIDEVYNGENLYEEGYAAKRPDLVCLAAPTYRITFPQTMQTDTAFVSPQKYAGHSSREQLDGIFYAWGTDVDQTCESPRMELQDYAPTVHHLLDVPVPEVMDGTARTALFDGCASEECEPQYGIHAVKKAVRTTARSIGEGE